MTIVAKNSGIGIIRRFTREGVHPYSEVEWEIRDARLTDHRDGSVAFEQLGVEVPKDWSQNATNILAQKYFRGCLGTAERETSLRQVIDRVVNRIVEWGDRDGYFTDAAESATFAAELTYLLVHQRAAFNSPVWFNIGVEDVPQQASACFILSVEDSMDSILNWYTEEGKIFKLGSGAGVNLSRLRASDESLKGGGTASGPVSFMRGADASAGTIKSGGKTRRAAKMVILDIDHPDIEEFIWCKAREERKARALEAAGFDMSLNGVDIHSIQYQNANNSVRVTDEFMQAVIDDRDWELIARGSDNHTPVRARNLFHQMAEASWQCADPGIQFDTTINYWNTVTNAGRINSANPCSEYMHLDNSACNLASLNLVKFLDDPNNDDVDGFNTEDFRHAVNIIFTAQEILVGNADYPTEAIGINALAFRQLGIGYANLGAMLMVLGFPYDSDEGRTVAANLTALMTGQAYLTSTKLAARMGAFAGFQDNRGSMLRILNQHRDAAYDMESSIAPQMTTEVKQIWDEVCERADTDGVRNSQASVLAPTGTIGLLMDCDTTGIEPDLGLVKSKRLVGGGTMSIVNQAIPRALCQLGYSDDEAAAILDHISVEHTAAGAPGLKPEHLGVFACSLGQDPIHYLGHIRMMGAVQPFLSGAISKTVNLPEDATVEEVEALFIESWRLGLKAVALYRNNCKVAQPLSVGKDNKNETVSPVRERLPQTRPSRTFRFDVAGCRGFVTIGEYEDGSPGEIFVRVSKQGSTLAGIMDAFAISLSYGLQYGVPLSSFVKAFVGMRFEPAGMTDDPEVRISSSLMDYIFRKLAIMYLDIETRSSMGIFTTDERIQPTLPGVEEQIESSPSLSNAPLCLTCGIPMQRSGACFVCSSCGATSGCS